MRTSTGARAGQYAALVAYLVFLGFPLLWLISTAFKSRELGSLHPTWIPRHPTLGNFRQAFDEQPLLHAASNSLLAALGAALIAVVIATPMAWVMARRRTPARAGRDRVGGGQPGVPVRAGDHPAVPGAEEPAADRLPGRACPGLRGVVAAVRAVDARRLCPGGTTGVGGGGGRRRRGKAADAGIGHGAPARAGHRGDGALFAFVTAWNEFFFALVLLKTPEKQTLPVVLTHFIGAEGVADLGPLAAAAFLATLPSLIVFALIQRRITGGMLTGAVKS